MKKLFTSALALILCISMTACGTWETQAINIVKVLTPASLAILEVAAANSGHPVSPGSVAIINRDLGDVSVLLQTLSNANAPAGTLAKLQEALQLVKIDIVPILELARVSNASNTAAINIMVDLAINEINAIISLSQPGTAVLARGAKKPLSANAFKKQFNAQLVRAGHGTIVVQ